MGTLKDRIKSLVRESPGLTDRELTDRLSGASSGQQAVNQAARSLAAHGLLLRRSRPDSKIGNFAPDCAAPGVVSVAGRPAADGPGFSKLCEDDVKRGIKAWLEADGWRVDVKWGREHGVDIEARRGDYRWVIEAKGCGSLNPMRVNYFIAILGEILQRMDQPATRYSIALPDVKQFRRLWDRLPLLAKSRTHITALFVAATGDVKEVK